jgi:single-strand DNA-binding protein
MNTHTILGRMVRDPEFVKDSDEKKNRVKFTVAVDRSYGDEADFIDCIVWGKRAAVIDKYFSKGSKIALYGEGRTGSYTDRNGVKRKTYTILVRDFDFCESRRDNEQTARQIESDARSLLMEDNFTEQAEDIPF